MSVRLRPAATADAEALAKLARRSFCETFVEGFALPYSARDLQTFLAESYAPDAVRAWTAARDGALVLAEAPTGELLGYAQTGSNTLPYEGARREDGELKRLYVARAAQGLGLGRALLEAALASLEGRRVLIGVWSGNDKALRLYRRYGFVPVGAYGFRVGETLDEELILLRT